MYELCAKVKGRPRRLTLLDGTSLAQARKALTKLRAERDAGTSPLGTRQDPRLSEAARLAIVALHARTQVTGKGRISPATVDKHEQNLRDHVLPRLATRKVSTIRKRDILSLFDDLRGEGAAEWSIHGVETALRTVFRHARENDMLIGDPFQGIPRHLLPAQEARSEQRVLRSDEVNRLLAELRRRSVRDLAVGTVLSDGNLRASELCGLRWRHVSLTDGTISVEGQLGRDGLTIVPTKSRASVRTIPLTPRAREALEFQYMRESERGLGEDHDFVFTTRTGRPLDRHNVRRTIREAAKAAGIGHVTPQVLRRSIATAFAEAGVPGHVAASITGHSPAVYHAHYVKPHLDQQERQDALGRLLDFGYGAE